MGRKNCHVNEGGVEQRASPRAPGPDPLSSPFARGRFLDSETNGQINEKTPITQCVCRSR